MTQVVKQSMYNILEEHYAILRMIEDAEGEIAPHIEEALALTQESFQEKAISYGFVYKSFDDTEEVIDKEIKRLQALKEKAAHRKELFKNNLSKAMQTFGVEKIETPTLKIFFRKSEAVVIEDEAALPDEYKRVVETVTPDKQKIKYYLKEGKEIQGAKLVTNQNIQIK